MNIREIIDDLNKKSGLLGVSEVSNDYRDILKGIEEGNEKCILANKKFVNTIVSYISYYYVLLNKADIVVFTAGVGENNPSLRKEIIEKLSCLGIKINDEENNTRGEIRKISTDESKVLVYVIPTDEEIMIAKDTLKLVTNR